MCTGIFPTCIHACLVSTKSEGGIRSPGAGVTNSKRHRVIMLLNAPKNQTSMPCSWRLEECQELKCADLMLSISILLVGADTNKVIVWPAPWNVLKHELLVYGGSVCSIWVWQLEGKSNRCSVTVQFLQHCLSAGTEQWILHRQGTITTQQKTQDNPMFSLQKCLLYRTEKKNHLKNREWTISEQIIFERRGNRWQVLLKFLMTCLPLL